MHSTIGNGAANVRVAARDCPRCKLQAPSVGPIRLQISSANRAASTRTQATPIQRPSTPPTVATKPLKGPTFVDPWAKIVEAEKAGTTLEVSVKGLNKGGLIVAQGELKGFLPYNQLAATTTKGASIEDLKYLVGQTLKVKLLSVDVAGARKEYVASEKRFQQSESMKNMKMDRIMKAVVSSVEDYGAFVELVDLPGVAGLVHKSELSWDSVMSVDSIVKKGQVVMVKIIDLDIPKCRLGLSIKQTQPDPIKMTLDKVVWGPTKSIPTDIQQLMDRLKSQAEVDDVYIGRQATESKIASQELVVYLTKDTTDDGFDIVARLGNVMQELHVVTKLSRDEARGLLTRVASQN